MDRSLKTRLEARLADHLAGPVRQRHDQTEIRIRPADLLDVMRTLHDDPVFAFVIIADLAIEAARRHPEIKVTGIDFVSEMLAPGRSKIALRGLAGRIRLLQADAMGLPFPDESFDAVGIAFGIRNIPDRLAALREMRRVLVPGGRVYILEMNAPQSRLWRGFFAPYLNRVLPRIARLFSQNPAAYLYLVDSITHFPPPPTFLTMMEETGFGNRERYSLTLGITSLYLGQRSQNRDIGDSA